ncbi:hypothetical protein [Aestuariibacter sp. A3R04]|uniref:hypothetical protein n=1 Tax=Aestuariibacter sp. A3R04 TaxID=2841571 RepID=UPI001C0A22E2|nr:hypothetical protein [Aestuariibacter sp. A3R04]MBU3020588.1 hypothetical protein [Aestuariibacter sp. A3R04]
MKTRLIPVIAAVALVLCAFGHAQQVSAQDMPVDDVWADMAEWGEEDQGPFHWAGFLDIATGRRLQTDDAINRKTTLEDLRLQIQADYAFDNARVGMRTDVYYDGVKNNLNSQIRELYWQGNLGFLGANGGQFDLKIGQQILTWGTGDYVFLNDLFPKDYQSFFAGRDDDYLKAPSLAIKLSGYFDLFNVDVVVTPQFEPDNGINGEYFSYFSPLERKNIADEFHVLDTNTPASAEYAVRLYRALLGTELALYGYKGFTKLPEASDSQGEARYSNLTVTGFSAVRPLGRGLAKLEYAYYHGGDDKGNNPLSPNHQTRLLAGYEQELVANLTGGVQWYTEFNHDTASRINASLWPVFEVENRRHVLTTQLRYLAMRQTLSLQLFNFYSPTDKDGYVRIRATYSPVDNWQLSGSVNGFYGERDHTFYGQFNNGTNMALSFRYFFEE